MPAVHTLCFALCIKVRVHMNNYVMESLSAISKVFNVLPLSYTCLAHLLSCRKYIHTTNVWLLARENVFLSIALWVFLLSNSSYVFPSLSW